MAGLEATQEEYDGKFCQPRFYGRFLTLSWRKPLQCNEYESSGGPGERDGPNGRGRHAGSLNSEGRE